MTRLFLIGTWFVGATLGPLSAQQRAGGVFGEVHEIGSGQALPGVHVRIEELNRVSITDPLGRYSFRDLPSGTYHLIFRRLGYRPVHEVVSVGDAPITVNVTLEPSAIELPPTIVTGVVGAGREGEETVRPVNVLSGRDLDRKLENTLAATLAGEPGLTQTSMGPAASRPVIRGLSGDRVLVLEDGARTGDVSGTSPDHAVATDGSSAERIEVLRGPAALVFGSNALGGVINVIRDEVPITLPDHLSGSASLHGQSVTRGLTAQGHVVTAFGSWAVRGEGLVRRTGDLRTPEGILPSTDVATYTGGVGAARIGAWGSLGAAYRINRVEYGVPGGFTGAHPAGVRIEMDRHTGRADLTLAEGVGPLSHARVTTNAVWYQHREIEPGGIVGTRFEQLSGALDAQGEHPEVGPFDHGAVGLRAALREYRARGGQGTPDSRLFTLSAFVLEHIDHGRFRIEAGVRGDWTRAMPLDSVATSVVIGHIRTRTFGAVSGSVGGVVDLSHGFSLGGSVARAFRTPEANELFSQGPHLAVFAYEVGNTELSTEKALGFDAFLRANREDLQVEVAAFRNVLDDFIYSRATGDTLVRLLLPIYQFVGEDAELVGLEGRFEWIVTGGLVARGNASYVRGTLTDADEPLPFMPPLQMRGGLRYETPLWFVGGDVRAAADQDRTAVLEAPTDGYVVADVSGGLRWFVGGQLHSITLRVTNLGNTTYRDHLSRVRAIMPEAGRDVNLLYRLMF